MPHCSARGMATSETQFRRESSEKAESPGLKPRGYDGRAPESSAAVPLAAGELGELLLHPPSPALALLLGRLNQIAHPVVVVVRLPVWRLALPGWLGVAPVRRVDPVEVGPQRRQVPTPMGLQPRTELLDLGGAGWGHLGQVGRRLVRDLAKDAFGELIVGLRLLAETLVLLDRVRIGLVVRVTGCLRRELPGTQREAVGKGQKNTGCHRPVYNPA